MSYPDSQIYIFYQATVFNTRSLYPTIYLIPLYCFIGISNFSVVEFWRTFINLPLIPKIYSFTFIVLISYISSTSLLILETWVHFLTDWAFPLPSLHPNEPQSLVSFTFKEILNLLLFFFLICTVKYSSTSYNTSYVDYNNNHPRYKFHL